MNDVMKERKLMAQLGTACGCIERCLRILNEYDNRKPLDHNDEREMIAKLEKALDAVLKTAVAIEEKSDDR